MYLLNFHIIIILFSGKYYITHNISCKTERPRITDGKMSESVNTKYKISKSIFKKN